MRGVPTVGGLALEPLLERLRGPGVSLDFGACVARFRSTHRGFARSMQTLYGAFPIEPDSGFADVTVYLRARRALFGPGWVELVVDGELPFESQADALHLPLLEWGLNWTIAHRSHAWLLLHSGVVARGDRALLMPAFSGVGKSTLTAALMCHGYRLLSDEFCPIDPVSGSIYPLLRPICLKNASIDVIGRRWPERAMGPRTGGTHKGTVAHLAPTPPSVLARKRPARPEFVVFPRYSPGQPPSLEPVPATRAFVKLSGNAFNYSLLGEAGFVALTNLLAQCRIYELHYSSFDEAFEHIDALFAESEAVSLSMEPARR
ncbi:MAG: HprK-related kinase A [Burkholderiaceae bacterium]|jgi:HprK-related kinase A|nr:HprK-related kinase A [Burkholderiaceae bacterium]